MSVRITITAKHVKISDKIKDYARGKLAKLERYYDKINSIYVILDRDGMNHVCEINITTDTHNHTTATVYNQDDITAAIDLCMDKAHRQVRRIKEKLKGHKGADKRKKLGRDVKRKSARIPRETTYEEAKDE